MDLKSLYLINSLPMHPMIISHLISYYKNKHKDILKKYKKFFSNILNKTGLEQIKILNKDINDTLQIYNIKDMFINIENVKDYVHYNKHYTNSNCSEYQKRLKQRSENSLYMKSHPGKFTEYQRRHPPSDRPLNRRPGEIRHSLF